MAEINADIMGRFFDQNPLLLGRDDLFFVKNICARDPNMTFEEQLEKFRDYIERMGYLRSSILCHEFPDAGQMQYMFAVNKYDETVEAMLPLLDGKTTWF